MFYVYILQGSRYYVGYTNNLERRVSQHQQGKTSSTSRYGQLSLVGYFLFSKKEDATKKEAEIKKSKNIKKRINSQGFITMV